MAMATINFQGGGSVEIETTDLASAKAILAGLIQLITAGSNTLSSYHDVHGATFTIAQPLNIEAMSATP